MSRTSLETQKLDLMDEVSSLKLKLVSMEETRSAHPQDSVDRKQNKAEVWNKPVCFCLFHCSHVAQLSKIRTATAASQIQGLTSCLYQCAISRDHCNIYTAYDYQCTTFHATNIPYVSIMSSGFLKIMCLMKQTSELGTYTWLQMLNLLLGSSAVLSEGTCLYTLDH